MSMITVVETNALSSPLVNETTRYTNEKMSTIDITTEKYDSTGDVELSHSSLSNMSSCTSLVSLSFDAVSIMEDDATEPHTKLRTPKMVSLKWRLKKALRISTQHQHDMLAPPLTGSSVSSDDDDNCPSTPTRQALSAYLPQLDTDESSWKDSAISACSTTPSEDRQKRSFAHKIKGRFQEGKKTLRERSSSLASSTHSEIVLPPARPVKGILKSPSEKKPAILKPEQPRPTRTVFFFKRKDERPTLVRFSKAVSVHDTLSMHEYDRGSDPEAVCTRLTAESAHQIKEELNAYKLHEMQVHDLSRVHTHFFF
ncbi:hypothetical protein DFQ28_005748 [Apophysomyces sp. BC1034]|nr:hypothetical protein DFQ30_003804 [Apophysomyces sp. BC1015]KAG0182600.1 hypothetical protein DFQ29_003153 [Apophysomyces sp. BC1021]KAG0193305.1 hypothetical protein DFQ28_005748 [Apophysomyces sp. BC1034]